MNKLLERAATYSLGVLLESGADGAERNAEMYKRNVIRALSLSVMRTLVMLVSVETHPQIVSRP